MTSVLVILINIFLVMFASDTSINAKENFVEQNSIQAIAKQELQSFYAINPKTQKRNRLEIWEDEFDLAMPIRD